MQITAEKRALLNKTVSRRVRTNHHVVRTNRTIRFFEEVRYKWRRRKMPVRFVVLRLERVLREWVPTAGRKEIPVTQDAGTRSQLARTSSRRIAGYRRAVSLRRRYIVGDLMKVLVLGDSAAAAGSERGMRDGTLRRSAR